MPKSSKTKREQAFDLWIESKFKKKLVDIAKELGVAASTVRKWKSVDKWEERVQGNAPDDEVERSRERYSSAKGNQRAKGNKGGGASKGNTNAISHGLFAKWMPNDVLEIMTEVNNMQPVDILWQNILIQYTAIIRAQKIMYVVDYNDTQSYITEVQVDPTLRDEETGQPIKVKEKREWEHARDKQDRFLSSQSRAIGTLQSLVRQFISIADDEDKRRLELESMQLKIDESKLNINRLQAELVVDDEVGDDGFMEALKAEGAEMWPESDDE